MQLKDMRLGKSIDILINREGYNYKLVSKVEEIGIGKIYITLITAHNRVFMFRPEDKIQFIYKTEERLWVWSGAKGSIEELEGERVHCLTVPDIAKSYNRRNSYRVLIGEEICMRKYTARPGADFSEETEEKEEIPIELDPRYEVVRFEGKLKNLSESGIGIFTNEPLKEEDEIYADIPTKFGMMASVARVKRAVTEREGDYDTFYGCEFVKSDKRLGKYLFDLQREQLKKMKGIG